MARRNKNLERVKTLLWAVMGVWAVITIARFRHGIGATSGLTDVAPWGFWIAFDVMAGVALAAGGFVVAAMVHIFGMERYHAFARPAILTALLGYIAVAVGLLYDLGIPWHIWHPMVFPQHHSVLFEVAMCVMCYLTVLALEFSPAVLEHPLFHRPFFQRILRVIEWFTIPLIIAGIVLSTLHQSSLGSLFLIQPFRVHPLWYSPYLHVLFFTSAVGLGFMMVVLEALVSGWLFKHKVDRLGIAGLGRIASFALSIYVLLRLGDLWHRGIFEQQLDAGHLILFVFEIAVSAVIPAILLTIRRVRESIAGMATCSIMTVLGTIGYRFDVGVVAFSRPENMPYWPTWTEVAISAGIVAGAVLVFVFLNENLRIVDHGDHGHADAKPEPLAAESVAKPRTSPFSSAFRRHSLAFVIAAGLAVGLLPVDAVFGPTPRPTPVSLARSVEALSVPAPSPLLREFHITSLAGNVPASRSPEAIPLMLIDGNRDWRFVAFTHDAHIKTLGGDESCRLCHHQNMTFDQNSACYQCHRDMYETTDIFDHSLHISRLGGNQACVVCHSRNFEEKTRENALACWECHGDMQVRGSIIPEPEHGIVGIAPGYMEAMHGLCIRCHRDLSEKEPETYGEEFDRCDVCHREFGDRDFRKLAPYVPMPPGHLRLESWKQATATSREAKP